MSKELKTKTNKNKTVHVTIMCEIITIWYIVYSILRNLVE